MLNITTTEDKTKDTKETVIRDANISFNSLGCSGKVLDNFPINNQLKAKNAKLQVEKAKA